MSDKAAILFDYLRTSLQEAGNPSIAKPMEAYLKNKFLMYGIKSPERRLISKPFYCDFKKDISEVLIPFVHLCWEAPHRDLQYVAMDMLKKLHKQLVKDDINHLEHWITHKSWWDTVDFLASTPVGFLVQRHPEILESHIDKWIESDNMWLQRTAIIHQLKFKDEVDVGRLERYILSTVGSKEFFINKATGWALRQYGKFNKEYVLDFVHDHPELSNLTKREALKHLT